MSPKDNSDNTNNPKTRLMEELKSIKGVLDEGDDNIPLLRDDDEDIPVLTSADVDTEEKNQASLQDALRQLESLELSPKSSRDRAAAATPTSPPTSLEDKIRANAAPPIIKTTLESGRENPFLTRRTPDRLEESRKQAREAQGSSIGQSRGAGKITTPLDKASVLTIKDDPSATAVEFSLPSSPAKEPATTKTPAKPARPEAEDAADEILKLIGGSSELELDLDEDLDEKLNALKDIDLDNLDEIDLEDDKQPTKSGAVKTTIAKTLPVNAKELDKIIDEIVEEYITILEAALKKKLKEKLPDLLKK